jgi:hypothetical protein
MTRVLGRVGALAAMAAALAACGPPSGTSCAKPGFDDAQVKAGLPVWVRPSSDETTFRRHRAGATFTLVSATRDEVKVNEGKTLRTFRRADVILPANVKAGAAALQDEIEGCPRVVGVASLALPKASLACPGGPREIDADHLELLSPAWFTARTERRAYVAVLWLVAVGFPLWLRRATKRAERARYQARAEIDAASSAPRGGAKLGERTLDVLACTGCGGPVALVDAPSTTCAHCRAPVAIPPEYVALVRAAAELRAVAARHAAALRRFELAVNPLFAIPLAGATVGLFFALNHAGDVDAIGWAAPTMVGLLFGLFFATIGQLVAFADVRSRKEALAAAPIASGGHACRVCGAPLSSVEDGVARACVYCGAQSLLVADAAAAASRDRREAAEARASAGELVADARLHVLEMAQPVAFYVTLFTGLVAIVGTLLLGIVG